MSVVNSFKLLLITVFLSHQTTSLSFNQPKFCPSATWNSTAVTFSSSPIVGNNPNGVFVDTSNTVYVGEPQLNRVQVWPVGHSNPTRNISNGLQNPQAIFVTTNGDIYIDNGSNNHRVDKWTLNATTSTTALTVTDTCYGLFVDKNNFLFCSNGPGLHQVIKKSLNNNATNSTLVAGIGTPGTTAYALDQPRGIFVDNNINLYVADCQNNRIQLFKNGQKNATTVAGAGAGAPGNITLKHPTGVLLDSDGYLFIVDSDNDRIIASGPLGFRCIIACSNSHGSSSTQLNKPFSMSFDRYGNIFVADQNNNRIQKFLLSNNSCYEATTHQAQLTTDSINVTRTSLKPTTQSTSQVLASASNMVISNQNCSPPGIILIPSTSSLASPMQFQRQQDFYINSNIYLNCNTSLAMITKWTVSNCTSICSQQIVVDQTISTAYSEVFIPARTLPYGLYELKLTVTMVAAPRMISSASAYVEITQTGITPNLVQLGTLYVTHGYQEDLILDPGQYSIDPDENSFNGTDWIYEYYCRIYSSYNFPNIQGVLIPIDDSRIDLQNPSCLKNSTLLQYRGSNSSLKSSIKILPAALPSNRTYQFMVYMVNRRNSSRTATGYLLVQVEIIKSPMIYIACVISTLCSENQEFQLVNPTTQVALFSICPDNCTVIKNITWNVYQGFDNGSSTTVQWVKFNQMNLYENNWFFGVNTSNFTATNQLFLNNPQIMYWQFEVMYSFSSDTSSSALSFIINQPPTNGSCSISPLNGTTSTSFTISCPDWFDKDGIQDYSLYVYTADISIKVIIAFSAVSNFQVFLPAGNDTTSLLNIIINIRDTSNCITEYYMSPITVRSDSEGINKLITTFQNSANSLTSNPLVRILSSGNQNAVGQIITSLANEFNNVNTKNIEDAISNGISATTISVSSLGESQTSQTTIVSVNNSATIEYNSQLNSYANVRDYLITFTSNLLITTSDSIKLQASSLARFTEATNQLTQKTSMLASDKCYQLAQALYSMANKIPYEDVQTAANQISQCASNVLTAINGPLQQRTSILDLDFSRSTNFPSDYDTDLESVWAHPNLVDGGNDYSWG
ncbi:unnamed protein product, partial [Adineta steineri]